MLKSSAYLSLQTILNQALALDPKTYERLKPLDEMSVRFVVQPIEYEFFIYISNNQVNLQAQSAEIPAATISATPLAYAKLFHNNRQQLSELINQGTVTLEGDLTVIQQLQLIFTELSIDWQQHLSKIIGDIAAYQVNKFWQQGKEFGDQLFAKIQNAVSDYIQEEARLSPTPEEIDEFNHQLETLILRVDRLTANVMNLAKTSNL